MLLGSYFHSHDHFKMTEFSLVENGMVCSQKHGVLTSHLFRRCERMGEYEYV